MAISEKRRRSPSDSPSKVTRGRPPKKEKLFTKVGSFGSQNNRNTNQAACTPSEIDSRNKLKRAPRSDSLCETAELRSSVFKRAQEVQANLDPRFPTMIKSMLLSHVTGGFWLGLPKKFCEMHLPKNDSIITLEDVSGKVHETKFLVEKVGLSAGWRGFSISHNLLLGDVLVFQLSEAAKFKVYIVRRNGSDEVDGAHRPLELDGCKNQMDVDFPCKNGIEAVPSATDRLQSENGSEDFKLEGLNGLKLSESVIEFNKVKSVDNFSIVVNGLVMDSEFSSYIKTKYYHLCCSAKSFLHDHLLEGLNSKLIVGMISETINIADAIGACQITTSQENFSTWDKTLGAFEVMGLNVSFLRVRLNQLSDIALKSKRYDDARRELELVKDEMKTLEVKLLEMKKTKCSLHSEIETIQKINPDKFKVMFQEVANAPWR